MVGSQLICFWSGGSSLWKCSLRMTSEYMATPAMYSTCNSWGSCWLTWSANLPTPLTVCNLRTSPSSSPWNIIGMRRDRVSCGKQEGESSLRGSFFLVWESMAEGTHSPNCPSWFQVNPMVLHPSVYEPSLTTKRPLQPTEQLLEPAERISCLNNCQISVNGLGQRPLTEVKKRHLFPLQLLPKEYREWLSPRYSQFQKERGARQEIGPIISPNQWWTFFIHCCKKHTKDDQKHNKTKKTRKMVRWWHLQYLQSQIRCEEWSQGEWGQDHVHGLWGMVPWNMWWGEWHHWRWRRFHMLWLSWCLAKCPPPHKAVFLSHSNGF